MNRVLYFSHDKMINLFKSRFQALIYISILCFVLGCSSSTPKHQVFRYNQTSSVTSLDPAFAKSQANIWIAKHLFNTLVTLDDSLHLKPDLAKSWEIDSLGLTYTFILKPSIPFHNNPCFENKRYLDAYDVQYSFMRLIDQKINSPGSWIFKHKLVEKEPFTVVNDSTFQIKLTDAHSSFLSLLTMQYCSVLPKECVEYYGNEWRSNPVGTGPLKFKKWIENQNVFLIKHEDYFEKPIDYDAVKVSFIKDRYVAILEMLNNNIDFTSGVESTMLKAIFDDQGELKEKFKQDIELIKKPYLNTEYIGFNLNNLDKDHPLQIKAFRQALNYSINREELLLLLRNNIGTPADKGFTPSILLQNAKPLVHGYDYKPSKAKSLLSESNIDLSFFDDNPLTIHTNKDYEDIMTLIAYQWSKMGVKTKVKLMDSGLLREGMRNGNLSIFRASWIADYPNPENFLSVFYSKNGAPPNYTRFNSVRYDELYEQLVLTSNQKDVEVIVAEMENIITDLAPVILLYYDQTAIFKSKRISGLEVNAMNLLDVQNIQILN